MALFVLMVSPHGPRLPAKFDRVLGDMTYLLFLIHYPVMKLFQESKPFSDVVNVTIVTVLCVVGTVGLFYLFEAPIDRIRDRIRGKVIE
jgi:peptidoglycan/LPS O-acetylase OafA/YrhL